MAKAVKVLCDRCGRKVIAGASFCRHCGCPTRWATHDERTAWEVSQWKTADSSHAPNGTSTESRRWNPFGRRGEPKPTLTIIRSERPKLAASPAVPRTTTTTEAPTVASAPEPVSVVTKAVDPAPARVVASVKQASRTERVAPRPKPIAKAEPAPPAAPSVAPGPRDAEPVTDTPATVMAMRLLNARVAELDAKVQRLERELEGSRPISHTS